MTLSNNSSTQLSEPGNPVEFGRADIGVIGTGTIAGMLVHCLGRAVPDTRVLVAGRNDVAVSELADTAGNAVGATLELVAASAAYIFLAVPPDAYPAVLNHLRAHLRPETVIISLTNGISLATLENLVENPIVKVIPTIAQRVGRGSTIVVAGSRADSDMVGQIVSLLSCFSKPVVVEDSDSRIASNLAGSALALFSEFAKLLISAHEGREGSVSQDALVKMTAETMGAIGDLVRDGYDFQEIIDATAAPGGMTEAAVRVLHSSCEGPVKATIEETFRKQKSVQLELDQSGT